MGLATPSNMIYSNKMKPIIKILFVFLWGGRGAQKNYWKPVPSFCKDDIVTVVGVSALLELELSGVVTDSTWQLSSTD